MKNFKGIITNYSFAKVYRKDFEFVIQSDAPEQRRVTVQFTLPPTSRQAELLMKNLKQNIDIEIQFENAKKCYGFDKVAPNRLVLNNEIIVEL